MSFSLVCGTWCLRMMKIVLIPWTFAGIPCANLPNSFPHECCHASLYFDWPVACISTIFPCSHLGLILVEHWPGCAVLLSSATHIHSCVMVACQVFDNVFSAGPNVSISWVNGVIGIGWGGDDVGFCSLRCCVVAAARHYPTPLELVVFLHNCVMHHQKWFGLFWCWWLQAIGYGQHFAIAGAVCGVSWVYHTFKDIGKPCEFLVGSFTEVNHCCL